MVCDNTKLVGVLFKKESNVLVIVAVHAAPKKTVEFAKDQRRLSMKSLGEATG